LPLVSTFSKKPFNEIDMKIVMDLRAKCKETFEKKYGIKQSFIFIKSLSSDIASLIALKQKELKKLLHKDRIKVFQNHSSACNHF
jgi:pyruvate/2-oxoglutarate dehydrogenase complex dihydrolipoamide acyltransferase (E2) component